MTQTFRCDRCGKHMEMEDMRALLDLELHGIPGGTAETPFGTMNKQRQAVRIWKDLCADCMRDLCAYLEVDIPEADGDGSGSEHLQ